MASWLVERKSEEALSDEDQVEHPGRKARDALSRTCLSYPTGGRTAPKFYDPRDILHYGRGRLMSRSGPGSRLPARTSPVTDTTARESAWCEWK